MYYESSWIHRTHLCDDSHMARKYELKRRAERQAETRRRIVEAAVELHTTVGPARTSVSAVAERAGIQRHTYYRHFPDERSLRLACSGLHQERDPFPDPDPWREIADPGRRLRRGLTELYGYYARNESLLAHLVRDADIDPPTREIIAARFGPPLAAIRETLAHDLTPGGRRARALAALDLALDFNTWRSLVRRSGLGQRQAVEVMVEAVGCLGRGKGGTAMPVRREPSEHGERAG
jgi:AcrR family transcriptional regulator